MLRAARPLDAGAVGLILSEFASETDWMPRIHSRAQDLAHAGQMIDLGWVDVAEKNGAVVGFLARDGVDIQALYVARGARGGGIGAALLARAQQGAETLQLWVFQANTEARRFYRRHGFQESTRTQGAGNDEGLPDICYTWTKGTKK